MIHAVFFSREGLYTGFEITGHAGLGEYGRDILCSAVSSAAYLTANTLLEVVSVRGKVKEKEGLLRLELQDSFAESQHPLKGLRLHLLQLAKQYPARLDVCTRIKSKD